MLEKAVLVASTGLWVLSAACWLPWVALYWPVLAPERRI